VIRHGGGNSISFGIASGEMLCGSGGWRRGGGHWLLALSVQYGTVPVLDICVQYRYSSNAWYRIPYRTVARCAWHRVFGSAGSGRFVITVRYKRKGKLRMTKLHVWSE